MGLKFSASFLKFLYTDFALNIPMLYRPLSHPNPHHKWKDFLAKYTDREENVRPHLQVHTLIVF